MLKVKIFNKDSEAMLERDINEFLQQIGYRQNITINLVDIKFISTVAFNKTSFTAMIIYNETMNK